MTTPDDIRQHVNNLLLQKGISLNSASLMVGKDQTYLFQYVHRKTPKRLKEDVRQKLAEILNVSEQELTDLTLNEKPIGPLVKIDVLDAVACCGNGIENFSENVIGQHMMTLPALREFTSSAPENIKIIKAIGDSMIPTINSGDLVWIDVSEKTPSSDGLYLLCIGRDLMIKRIQINPFNNSATVKSDNPRYAVFEKENFADIQVMGKVIYHIQRVG